MTLNDDMKYCRIVALSAKVGSLPALSLWLLVKNKIKSAIGMIQDKETKKKNTSSSYWQEAVSVKSRERGYSFTSVFN